MASFDEAEMLLEGIEAELQQRVDVLLEMNESYRGSYAALSSPHLPPISCVLFS